MPAKPWRVLARFVPEKNSVFPGHPGSPDNALRYVERGNRLTVDGHIHFALGDYTIARYLSQQYEQEWQINLGPGWSFGIP
jgi:hypothetical protein